MTKQARKYYRYSFCFKQKEVQRLKLALADATLERDALESLLEVANEYYGVDMFMLKKTSNLGNPALFRK
jgi:hypothetical protein